MSDNVRPIHQHPQNRRADLLFQPLFFQPCGTLYLQERGLNLFQVNSNSAIIIGTIFLAEVPTGVLADRIGRKWSVVLAMAFPLAGEVLYLFARDCGLAVALCLCSDRRHYRAGDTPATRGTGWHDRGGKRKIAQPMSETASPFCHKRLHCKQHVA